MRDALSQVNSLSLSLNKRYHHLDCQIARFQLLPLSYLTLITTLKWRPTQLDNALFAISISEL